MMYYYHYPYPPHPAYPGYHYHYPITRQYPPVDVNVFTKSIKSYRLLIGQGSILLNRLDDKDFDVKLMAAAQLGNKAEVDRLMKTIGLKVPVETKYTPTGVTFELTTQPDPSSQMSCCTLSIHLKWGN
ncbi:hypothetical protein ABC255_26005 [Neobacillus sp. 3P2-tot-E-2]|uniref:hypothetical protein n=1 Tax=Neobacillus sp. 3P2-tot-E-2 TaxID=3132212 RepID=UPI00399EFCBB